MGAETIPQIVIDTNVMVAGLRSQHGSAFRLLQLVGTERFGIHLSVPLVLEYEYVLIKQLLDLQVSPSVVDETIDYHCAVAQHHKIFFLWRPHLRDPKDEMILELAVKAGCDYIITYNKRDFSGTEKFGIEVLNPGEFLSRIGDQP